MKLTCSCNTLRPMWKIQVMHIAFWPQYSHTLRVNQGLILCGKVSPVSVGFSYESPHLLCSHSTYMNVFALLILYQPKQKWCIDFEICTPFWNLSTATCWGQSRVTIHMTGCSLAHKGPTNDAPDWFGNTANISMSLCIMQYQLYLLISH